MIGFIDNKLGNFILSRLHKRRENVIAQTLEDYRVSRGANEHTLAALKEKLEFEMTRVFAIADESIVRERIMRARYTFWITAIIGTSFILAFAAFPVTTSIAPFFSPLVGAFVAWAVAIVTIPIGYNTRVKGAMTSAISTFELERRQPDSTFNVQNSIRHLQNEVKLLHSQVQQRGVNTSSTETSSVTPYWQRRTKSSPSIRQVPQPQDPERIFASSKSL